MFICPANGNQDLCFALNITGFLRRADEHECNGKHEGEAEEGVEQQVGKNVLFGALFKYTMTHCSGLKYVKWLAELGSALFDPGFPAPFLPVSILPD